MSDQLLASKIVTREEEPEVRQIEGVSTSVFGVVGVTERGPFTPQRVTSASDYRKKFGGYTALGYIAQAVDAYFGEGGSGATEMWVQRVVHFTDPTDPASRTSVAAQVSLDTASVSASKGFVLSAYAEPFNLAAGDTLLIDVDIAGAPTTVTLAAVAAARESGAGTFHLDEGFVLNVKIDRGPTQVITFATSMFSNHAAATAAEVASAINGQLVGASATVTSTTKVTITSDTKGTGSYVEVTGGTANAVLSFNTAEVNGSGNVADVSAVTAAEIAAACSGVSGTTVTDAGGYLKIERSTAGADKSVQVTAASTIDDDLGLDNAVHYGIASGALDCLLITGKDEGEYANALSATIAAASSGDAARFNLLVLKGTIILETWPNLSMLDTDANYIEKVINDATNGSWYIAVTDLDASDYTSAANDRPVNGSYPLAGGRDGLTGLVDGDFVGGVGTGVKRTGIRGLDTVEDLSMIAVPGRATSTVHNALVAYCSTTRNGSVFPILGSPQGSTAEGIVTYTETTAGLLEFSEFGAMYWPWLKVSNPNRTIFGDTNTILVPPESHVAGANARKDGSMDGGVYNAAAGVEDGVLVTCLGFETEEVLDEGKRDLVYPKRINPITTSKGMPRFIDGCRTLKGTGNFPSVPERRGVIFIEQSIKRGLQFARHKNNDDTLRARVSRTCNIWLEGQCKAGAFRSKDPSKAFFVDFGSALNPLALTFAGKLKGRIGLATQKPAEFIILSFSQDTRAFTPAA